MELKAAISKLLFSTRRIQLRIAKNQEHHDACKLFVTATAGSPHFQNQPFKEV